MEDPNNPNKNNKKKSSSGNNNQKKGPNDAPSLNKNKRMEYELERKKKEEMEKIRKEKEIEEQIRDSLKCYICLTKVTKPRMCKICKRISCDACIRKWLENHNCCGICKSQATLQDMILIPFLDDMSSFFINNIDNQKQKAEYNLNKTFYSNKNFGNISERILNKDNNINEIEESTEINKLEEFNDNICIKHGNKIEYYCIQCNQYFCGQCLIFFGDEGEKHKSHFVMKIEKINDLGVGQAINEYKKLSETKKSLDDLIGMCNCKIKENQIKKYKTLQLINEIRESTMNELEKERNNLRTLLSYIKKNKNSIQEKLSNQSNNNNQIQDIVNTLKGLNKFEPKMERDIQDIINIDHKLCIENHQSDFIEFEMDLLNRQFQENEELVNYDCNIVPNHTAKLVIKYAQNKAEISLTIKVTEPVNSHNYPTFNSYIIFKCNKYGLEFINLIVSNFDLVLGQSNIINNKEQILSSSIEIDKFKYLAEDDNKIHSKIYIIKSYYK